MPPQPSLLDKIKANQEPSGPRCGVALLRDELSPAWRQDLDDALAEPRIHASVIGKTLRDEGHKITDDALRRHRKNDCACGGGDDG